MCTSRKGSQLNKRSQNVKNTTLANAGHVVGALRSTLPFLHKFQPFLPEDTFFEENMKRYVRCLKIIHAACFFTDPCHENFPKTQFSSCCQPFFPITVESQHNFLRHRNLSRDLLTVNSIRRSEVENATF